MILGYLGMLIELALAIPICQVGHCVPCLLVHIATKILHRSRAQNTG